MNRPEHPVLEEELMAYVDGELEAAQTSQITEHLETCADCAASVADAKRLSMQLSEWRVEEPSAQFSGPVLSELRSRNAPALRPRPVSAWNRYRVWAYGACAVAVLILAVITPTFFRPKQAGESINKLMRPPAETSAVYGDIRSPGQQGQGQQQGGRGQQGQQAEQKLQSMIPQRQSQSAPRAGPSDVPSGPMVIRTARLIVVAKDAGSARSRIEAIVRQYQGYVDQLNIRGEVGTPRTLSATLRLPSDRLDAGLNDLRALGKVREESQNSSDVTSQVVDLRARQANARNTEQRLINLLRERTGDLADVVNAERELARVREEIERMEAQQKDYTNKVAFASIQLELTEEYHAQVEPTVPSTGTRLQNALIDGYRSAIENGLGIVLVTLRYGPALLLWLLLALPIALVVRRFHPRI